MAYFFKSEEKLLQLLVTRGHPLTNMSYFSNAFSLLLWIEKKLSWWFIVVVVEINFLKKLTRALSTMTDSVTQRRYLSTCRIVTFYWNYNVLVSSGFKILRPHLTTTVFTTWRLTMYNRNISSCQSYLKILKELIWPFFLMARYETQVCTIKWAHKFFLNIIWTEFYGTRNG